MSKGKKTTFTYESSRHGSLMEEYDTLSSNSEFAAWGKKAVEVADYMRKSLEKVKLIIKVERSRFDQENDKRKKQALMMAIMQLTSLHKLVQKQLDDLIEVMDKLPSGSVREEYEKIAKPWSPSVDTPYVRILVSKSGEVTMDGNVVDLDVIKDELDKLAQNEGLVLYSREVEDEGDFPSVAKQIMEIIISNRLPVQLCEQSDFSDAIDEKGNLRVSN